MPVLQQKSSLTQKQAIPTLLNNSFKKAGGGREKNMSHPNSLLGIIPGLF